MNSPNIAVWEEQDKINQELIPRVIRQNELLTGHIADHENLPLVAGNAIREASGCPGRAAPTARQMAEIRAEAEEQARRHAEIAAAKTEREEQSRQTPMKVTTLLSAVEPDQELQVLMVTGE